MCNACCGHSLWDRHGHKFGGKKIQRANGEHLTFMFVTASCVSARGNSVSYFVSCSQQDQNTLLQPIDVFYLLADDLSLATPCEPLFALMSICRVPVLRSCWLLHIWCKCCWSKRGYQWHDSRWRCLHRLCCEWRRCIAIPLFCFIVSFFFCLWGLAQIATHCHSTAVAADSEDRCCTMCVCGWVQELLKKHWKEHECFQSSFNLFVCCTG